MKKAHQEFIRQFSLLESSGTGVMFVRSREPQRVFQSVKAHSLANKRDLRRWDVATGWTVFNLASATQTTIKTLDGLKAIKEIVDIDNDGKNPFPAVGNYVVEGLHPWLATTASAQPNPVLVALLRHLARLLTLNKQRLIMVMPEAFNVPEELVHDIPVIDYDLPDCEELEDVIRNAFADEAEGRKGAPQTYTPVEIRQLATSAAGLTLLEAESAACQALIQHRDKLPRIPFTEFNQVLLAAKTEIVKNSGCMSIMPVIDIATVGGLDLAKKWIADRKLDFTPEAAAFGVKRPRGVTLIGPPGTGKSLLAKTIAGVLNYPAVEVEFGSLFAGIVGETEAKVRKMFKDIKALGKCLVFVDEIDRVMGMNTHGGDGGITKRVIGSFLTFMQNNESGAFFVFAANRAEGIDSALVRKGRVDEVFSVLPPNRTERLEILRIHLRKMKQDPDTVKSLLTVAEGSAGYVGAELEHAVAMAVSEAFRNKSKVSSASILAHLQNIKPLSIAFKDDFDSQRKWAECNATPASTPEPEKVAVLPLQNSPLRRPRRIGSN